MTTSDYLDVTQAGPTDCFPKLPRFQTAEEPELLRRLAAADLLDSPLLAAARRLLPHTVTAVPVHPPPLSSNPAPALFVQEQLPTLCTRCSRTYQHGAPRWAQPRVLLLLAEFTPSLVRTYSQSAFVPNSPTLLTVRFLLTPAAAYQSHPVFLSTIKLITNFLTSPECSLHVGQVGLQNYDTLYGYRTELVSFW
ncbi:hypothetical protein CHARACLAT_030381 [Characodon lateralis]|uniref:Uncharacterized protein n=1 Tax=Characodon lateralis TaxID=208331 RepID=A0ABU7D1Z3_9TELE|nr:hypothetical protein [Characodon lateralis]